MPADLATGVGLPAFMLCLLFAAGSSILCLLDPPAVMLGGLPFAAVPLVLPFMRLAGFGVGWSRIAVIAAGRRNMP